MESNEPITRGTIETMTINQEQPSIFNQSEEELDQYLENLLDEVEKEHKSESLKSDESKLTRKELRNAIEEILTQVLPERVKQTNQNTFTNNHNALPKEWRYIKTGEKEN